MTRRKNLVWAAAVVTAVAVIGMLTSKPVLAQIKAALVANVDAPGRIPYQGVVVVRTDTCCYSLPPVPSGKRLVMTNVAGSMKLNPPGVLASVDLVNQQTGAQVSNAATLAGTFAGQNVFGLNAPMQLVADSGQTIQMTISALASTPSIGIFTVSGYLLDCGLASCAPIVIQLVR